MPSFIVNQLLDMMKKKNITVHNSNILILGFAFKGDCADCRNTKVIDLVKDLEACNINVDIYDSWVDRNEVKREYQVSLINSPKEQFYDGVIVAVDHSTFKNWGADLCHNFCNDNHVLLDVKNVFNFVDSDLRI